jgi:hypothetical protein
MNIADRYAQIKNQIEALEVELKAARAEILATGMDKIEGHHCTVTVSLAERCTLDTKLARQFLTTDQLKACEKIALTETLRIKAKVAA